MTHVCVWHTGVIDFSECCIDRYSSNNGIAFKDKRGVVLFYIDGEDVGVEKEDLGPDPVARAEPIFKTMVEAHNRAFQFGLQCGDAERLKKVREALGMS